MRHSIKWHEDAGNAALEERATVADLRLYLKRDQNVTLHLLDGIAGDHVTVALYSLVNGLVHDWWNIFGARDQEVSLRRYRSGFLLPDLRLRFDGAVFEIESRQSVYDDPDLRFWSGGSEVLTRVEGEAWLTQLVQEVLTRLTGKGVHRTSAQLRWERILHSTRSVERSFCEAAGGLGLDPYSISDEAAAFVEDAENLFDDERLIEFAAGAREVDTSRLISWVKAVEGRRSDSRRLADLRPIVDAVAREVPEQPAEQPYAWGYRRARAVRRKIGLDQTHRLRSFKDLAVRFGAGKAFNVAPSVDGIRALRSEGPHGIHVHLRNHGDSQNAPPAHLFAMARSIGDAACFIAPETAPINDVHNAYRQAAGRAFAAEFLAPIDEISAMQRDRKDLHSIADEFGVSTYVIGHQIENRERIRAACEPPLAEPVSQV